MTDQTSLPLPEWEEQRQLAREYIENAKESLEGLTPWNWVEGHLENAIYHSMKGYLLRCGPVPDTSKWGLYAQFFREGSDDLIPESQQIRREFNDLEDREEDLTLEDWKERIALLLMRIEKFSIAVANEPLDTAR